MKKKKEKKKIKISLSLCYSIFCGLSGFVLLSSLITRLMFDKVLMMCIIEKWWLLLSVIILLCSLSLSRVFVKKQKLYSVWCLRSYRLKQSSLVFNSQPSAIVPVGRTNTAPDEWALHKKRHRKRERERFCDIYL